jgi:hypothetical protein
MIIKEYRVVMPVSVEEYQVAQLYMVAKLSAQQTGILVTLQQRFIISKYCCACLLIIFCRRRRRCHCFDERAFREPSRTWIRPGIFSYFCPAAFARLNAMVQYTKKIYHISSKLPGWLKAVLPTKATELHEEAWNAFAPPPLHTLHSN